jgi:hypothetical protein
LRAIGNQLAQDWTALEAGLGVVKDNLGHALVERDAKQDPALAGHQRIRVVAERGDVGGERCH